jgi:hypothetical protein
MEIGNVKRCVDYKQRDALAMKGEKVGRSRLSRDSPENLRQIPRPAFCMKCPANLLFHNTFNHFKI